MTGCRVVRTGHSAVLDKPGALSGSERAGRGNQPTGGNAWRATVSGCYGASTSWRLRVSMRNRCRARMRSCCPGRHEGHHPALVLTRSQWTVFAERLDQRTTRDSTPLDLGAALACLKQSSAPPLLPAAWVVKEKLPLSVTGGVDRERLSAEVDALVPGMEYEGPQGEIEVALAQIWQEVSAGRAGRPGR